jgi:predicted nucleic-acid-binding Zn-ribbon protein
METLSRCPSCRHKEWVVRADSVVVPGAQGPFRVSTSFVHDLTDWTCAKCGYAERGGGEIDGILDREQRAQVAASEAESLVVQAVLAEYGAIRSHVDFQIGRVTNLSAFSVIGAAAVLSVVASARLDAATDVSVELLLVAALALVQIAGVGIVGESFQAGDYLRDQGDFVRRILGNGVPDTFKGRNGLKIAPVLAWEELEALRTRRRGWVRRTSSLAALESAASVMMGLALFVWALYTLGSEPNSRDLFNAALAGLDALLAILALVAGALLLRLQDRRAADPR